ncbi:esterase-like activity of phytase family protein [Psychrobacter sp. 16-MNA-CIBAN-0192]|uniref:esterase-like activity of phytase family protein n=1 Tax=Psychrobacter sp. 16-MNA-CIBAN-0192 TaxID=3140448 RepID=UPI00331925F1
MTIIRAKVKTGKQFTYAALAFFICGLASSQSLQAKNNEAVQPLNFTQGTALPYSILDTRLPLADNGKKISIHNGGFGSDAAAHPTHANQFYALTDRGPNADFNGSEGKGKQFLTPDYTPRIGLFELTAAGEIKLIKQILLKDRSGKLINGLPNPKAMGGTNELAYDSAAKLITVDSSRPYDASSNPSKTDPNGLDAEGLAALKDGTFWVSDEYGPHIVHYNSEGVEMQRINAFAKDTRNTVVVNGKQVLLPAEFAKRRANRGMEGLTITPDQTTLIGIMQSSMDNPDKSGRDSTLTRIVSINLRSGEVKQYLYQQQRAGNANSAIVAINNHEFYVIERDGDLPLQESKSQKHIYKINLTNATDIESIAVNNNTAKNSIQRDPNTGILINKQTLEQYVAEESDAWRKLAQLGIKPVAKQLVFDAVKELKYPHDKLEGLWLRQDGTLGLLNDDDFSVETQENKLRQKYLDKEGRMQDIGRLYIVKPKQ